MSLALALQHKICTFAATGKQYTQQEWYVCSTCNPRELNVGCCESCKDVCHKGHNVSRSRVSPSRFYCDCGVGSMPFACTCCDPQRLASIESHQNEMSANESGENDSAASGGRRVKRGPIYIDVKIDPEEWTNGIYPDSENVFRVGVTGHRFFERRGALEYLYRELRYILTQALKFKGRVVGLTGLAEGTDQLFAEVCFELGIPVRAIVAHADFYNDFQGPAADKYQRILNQCESVFVVPAAQWQELSYGGVRDVLLRFSDLIVAAWNGLPAKGPGGTGDVVECAKEDEKPVLHINPDRMTQTSFFLDKHDQLTKVLVHRMSAYAVGSMLPLYDSNNQQFASMMAHSRSVAVVP